MEEHNVTHKYATLLGNRTFVSFELFSEVLREFDRACGTKTIMRNCRKCSPAILNADNLRYSSIAFWCQHHRKRGCQFAFQVSIADNKLKTTKTNHLVHNHYPEVFGK